jgi:drug/metabolite transporter (DMT)-like permease
VPLWVVLLRLLWRERVSRVTLAGVGLGFVGVALLVAPGGRPENAPLWSLAVLIAAAASWATGSFLTGKAPMPRDLFVSATLQMLLGGALMIAIGLAVGEGGELDLAAVSGRSIAGFVYLVIGGSLIAFTAYVWLLKNVPISTVTTYAFVNPVVAVLLGWAILGEEITTTIVVAAAVIVTSVAFVVRQETTTPEAHDARPDELAEGLEAAEPH